MPTPTKYSFMWADFGTASGVKPRQKTLYQAIQASSMTNKNCLGMRSDEDTVVPDDSHFEFEFNDALSGADETELGSVVAAHVGQAPVCPPLFLEGAEILEGEFQITSDQVFEKIAAIVTNPSFFNDGSTEGLFANIPFELKTQGSTVEIVVVEVADDGTEVEMLSATVLPDSSDDWQTYSVTTTTNPPSVDSHRYEIRGRLNGATSAHIRHASMSLMKAQ